MSGYDDFGLGLQLGAGGRIWVSASSRLGHVHGVTSVQPGGDVLAELSEHLYDLLDAIRFAEAYDATAITAALGTIAFGEPVVRELFQAARGAAADRGRQLIVRVQASPHLAALPWELLPDPSLDLGGAGARHLTLSPDVHVVRLSRGRTYPIRTEPVEPPLNLLFVLSSPMGLEAGDDTLTFDIYEAKRNLLGELMSLQDGGWLSIDVEDRPTMDNLRRRIRSKRRGYHLLHYLGHAEPDLLLLENERGQRRDVRGAQIVEWLRSCPDLRLVTFSGCETARPVGDPMTLPDSTDWQHLLSLAERAAQGSSPVVLGMQAVLPFRTEWLLTRSFYQALASGNTIVDALRLARGAVRSEEHVEQGLLDWAIPALFMNSAEPEPLLDRAGSPARGVRRRSNVAKLEPPTAGAGLIGRDVPLRQAVEVLAGRTRERVLVISAPGGVRAAELLDRALDEIDGEASDILSVPYAALADGTEAASFLAERDGDPSPEVVLRANLCGAVSQLLERSDARSRERRPDWTLRRWWAWLSEDLAGRRPVLAIDGVEAVRLLSSPLRTLAGAWLADAFPASATSDRALKELDQLVEQLRAPSADGADRHVEAFLAFLGDERLDAIARETLAEVAEVALDERLAARAAGQASPAVPADPAAVKEARRELAEARAAIGAVFDMLCRLVRRAQDCRVALVVDEVPENLLADVDDLVFPIRLGESTWPETWRWVRRSMPGLARFGQDRLKGVWRKYLGTDVARWEELERRVRAGALVRAEAAVAPAAPPPPLADAGYGRSRLETPETDLERLASVVCSRQARGRRRGLVPDATRRPGRQDRPLVVAAAAFLSDNSTSDGANPWQVSFSAFQARLNVLAEQHGIGGRVTTTTLDQLDTLAVLAPVPSPFRDGGAASEEDLAVWCEQAGAERPDIVLLDFGASAPLDRLEAVRRRAFPSHRTLQIAAGGNTPGQPCYPAWSPDVLGVGALDEHNQLRPFASRDGRRRKPDLFATDHFEPGSQTMGSSFSAAYAVVAAILVWTLLPESTPRAIRQFLVDAALPVDPERSRWPLRLDLDEAVAEARRRRVVQALARGRASLQAVVAITGLNWGRAEQALQELVAAGQVGEAFLGRDVVYELTGDPA